jgi:hypothetical protein
MTARGKRASLGEGLGAAAGARAAGSMAVEKPHILKAFQQNIVARRVTT